MRSSLRVGDEVRVLLQLPRGRGRVGASGRPLSPGETDGWPGFVRAEGAIRNAVAEALSEPDRRSILLLEERRPGWFGCGWLRWPRWR